MKSIIFFLFFLTLFITTCSDDNDIKLESFNAEAFVFDIGDSWEVNSSTRIKGYLQKEENNNFIATISYNIDLITPAGDTIKSLISKTEDFSENEKKMDTALKAQFELDSTYAEGKYKVVFNIRDINSEQTAVSTADFEIVNE